jgi:hypothetical protein
MKAIVRKGLVCSAAVAAGMLGASSASAGPWSQPNGASDSFTYANGGDVNGNFGDPIVSADTFFFLFSNFHVQSANGAPAGGLPENETDEVSFDVFANAGLQFSLVRVTAYGSYSASGPGANTVDLDANLSLTELGPNDAYDGGAGDDGRDFQGGMTTIPGFPQQNANGDWSGLAVVDLQFEFPVPDNALHISMTNDVVAISGANGSAEMNVQYQDFKIEFIVIPEPASMSLMAIGALALLRRRR